MSLVTTLYKDHKGVFDEKLFKLAIRRVSEPSPPEAGSNDLRSQTTRPIRARH
jgi:hypothetical protein